MLSFRIEGFEVARSGRPAPLYLKECKKKYIPMYVYVNVVHALMIYEHIVLPGFPMF